MCSWGDELCEESTALQIPSAQPLPLLSSAPWHLATFYILHFTSFMRRGVHEIHLFSEWCAVLSCSVMSDFATSCLTVTCQLLCLWDPPGKNTWMGCHFLPQGIFPTQGLNPGLPHCRQILYCLSHQGSPRILDWVAYRFSRGSSRHRNGTGVSCIAGGFWATVFLLL